VAGLYVFRLGVAVLFVVEVEGILYGSVFVVVVLLVGLRVVVLFLL
jgi:hypothetical protein